MRLLPLLAVLAIPAAAQTPAPVALRSPVADKNFYVLTQMAADPEVRSAIASDDVLGRIGTSKRAAFDHAALSCGADVACYLAAVRWELDEIDSIAGRLRELAGAPGPVRSLVVARLRPSGMFQRYAAGSDADLLASAWRDAARAIDNILAVYGEGKPPRYPSIDSVSFDAKSTGYHHLIELAAGVLDEQLESGAPFFAPSLRFALQLLRINGRDEAGRHEPLEAGENRAAYRAIAGIHWAEFPYTAIIVPGSGADRTTIRLSPTAYLRAELAAKRYRDKKAPLILVSGGYVHPNQTPFSEAIEMKRVLIEDFGIPEEAILVDPHARHTTTNLRNAVRLLFRYGVPMGRPALICTDTYQSQSIESPLFAERCRRELGYLPGNAGQRISRYDLEFTGSLDSLQADALDPLDP